MRARAIFSASLLISAAVLLFANFSSAALSANDTALHAGIARRMAETGHFGTPELYGAPWFEHLPPFLWLTAASFDVFGFGPGAARLPFLLLALLAVMGTAEIARRKAGDFAGFAAGIALVSTEPFWRYAGRVRPDVPMTAFIVLAVLFLVMARERPASFGPWIGFGLCAGMAAFFKGPMALAAPAALACTLLLERARGRRLLDGKLWLGLSAMILVPVPWILYQLSVNGDAWFDRYVLHQVLWLPLHDRSSPHTWSMVPAVLFRIYWPWVIVLALGLFRIFRAGLPEIGRYGEVLGWAAFVALVLTFSVRQTEYYLLPAYPAFAVVVGAEIARWITSERVRLWIARVFVAAAVVLLLAVNLTPLDIRRGSLEIETERTQKIAPAVARALASPGTELALAGFNPDRGVWSLSLFVDLSRPPRCFDDPRKAAEYLGQADHLLLVEDHMRGPIEASMERPPKAIAGVAGLSLLQGAAP